MNIKHYYLMSCLAFAVLQGCSSGFEEKTFTQSAFKIGNFAADGKVALRFPRCDEYRGCKEEAFSANLHWLHKAPIDELSLYDPTGQEALKITYQEQSIRLHDRSGEREISHAQLAQELGLPIPVEKLREWLFAPQDKAKFTADGWQIEVDQWQGQYYRRLTMRQKDYYLRILVNHVAVF